MQSWWNGIHVTSRVLWTLVLASSSLADCINRFMASLFASILLWSVSLIVCYEFVIAISWIVFLEHRLIWIELIPFYVIVKAIKWAMSDRR